MRELTCVWVQVHLEARGIDPPKVRVTGACELSDTGAGSWSYRCLGAWNQTQVLSKSSMCFWPPYHLSSPYSTFKKVYIVNQSQNIGLHSEIQSQTQYIKTTKEGSGCVHEYRRKAAWVTFLSLWWNTMTQATHKWNIAWRCDSRGLEAVKVGKHCSKQQAWQLEQERCWEFTSCTISTKPRVQLEMGRGSALKAHLPWYTLLTWPHLWNLP